MTLPSIRVGDRVIFQGKEWPVLSVRWDGPMLWVEIAPGMRARATDVKELER